MPEEKRTHELGLVKYDAYVHAWVLDLPGCVTGGRTLEEVMQKLPLVLAEHLAWLARHGEPTEEPGAWDVAETLDGTRFVSTGGEFCFDADRAPIAPSELDVMTARMAYARADLLDSIAHVPDAILDWAPPASAFESFDGWAPEVRTIRDVLEHVLQLEVYYRDGLHDGPAKGIFEPVADPVAERARTVELLRSLDDERRSRVYRPVRPSRSAPEEWTVRKVLRRIISHERAHTAEIWQRRSWVLLGAPVVRP